MNYSNPDFLNKGFNKLQGKYDLWLARWADIKEPGYDCGIWQYSSAGKINGISGSVDLNVALKNYPNIIFKKDEEKEEQNKEKAKAILAEIKSKINELEGVI